MAALSLQSISRAGVAPAYAAPGVSGDTFVPGGNTFIHVKATSNAVDVTVTVPAGKGSNYKNMTLGNLVVHVNAASEAMIGPIPSSLFLDPTNKNVAVSTSTQTGVTLGVFDLSS